MAAALSGLAERRAGRGGSGARGSMALAGKLCSQQALPNRPCGVAVSIGAASLRRCAGPQPCPVPAQQQRLARLETTALMRLL